MEIFGRLTADAKVKKLKDERTVVNFSIAMNESYKVKDSNEIKKATTYFNCSYWINDRIAKVLTKGTLVELYGRIGVSTYTNNEGDIKAVLTFHVNNVKLHGKSTKNEAMQISTVEANASKQSEDDLPF